MGKPPFTLYQLFSLSCLSGLPRRGVGKTSATILSELSSTLAVALCGCSAFDLQPRAPISSLLSCRPPSHYLDLVYPSRASRTDKAYVYPSHPLVFHAAPADPDSSTAMLKKHCNTQCRATKSGIRRNIIYFSLSNMSGVAATACIIIMPDRLLANLVT